ncbi:SDR family oxidoreductase [Maritimibacter sp. UBA3975]|uniref:SDR family NAD(P)-dependent oxidoreductase n=1 Tax=Maritimibacter sp. UBA3975 TaxID=1946833 RepID=UPI000C09352E|nr:SDR family oxidoreductase [Maritimibacter sp. UBA3975]MAM60774.1 3-oxoacyl-ACP reductase [Maritimibacter sp.]|tara:strand:- start:36233 stop:36997 length:765 start_codon:yes stop_codon:yes gene_type:complete
MDLPRTPSLRLDGKRALVTGAGRGIGLAAAAALAEAGASVTLAARSSGEIEAAAEAVVAAGGQADAITLDVSDIAGTTREIARSGPFDVLVNNAGTNRPKPVWEVSEGDYDAVLDLNLKAAYFVAKAVAEGLIAAGRAGSLIHMSSQMGQVSGPGRSLYSASKFAIEGMNKGLAIDLAPHGIRSNTIAPTFIETPLTRPFLDDPGFLETVLSKIKLGRLGQVTDLMGAVTFLASDASGLMTGSTLTVDGGWTAE